MYVADLESPLILRPLVLFAFTAGLLLARARARLDAADPYLWLWASLAACFTLSVMLANGASGDAFFGLDAALRSVGLDLRESVLYPLTRLFGSLAVWTLTARLAGSRAGRAIAAQMPWLFTTYCSHFLVLGVLWAGLMQPLGASGATPGFTLWFVGAPLVALAAGRSIVRLTLAWWPPGAILLGLRPARPVPAAGGDDARGPGRAHVAEGVAGPGVPVPGSERATAPGPS